MNSMLFKNKSTVVIVLIIVIVFLSILFLYNINKIKIIYRENFGLISVNEKCTVNKAIDKNEYILKSYASDMCTCPVSLDYVPSDYVSRNKAINVIKKICSKNGQKYCSEITKDL
jgi:hypothetical protein